MSPALERGLAWHRLAQQLSLLQNTLNQIKENKRYYSVEDLREMTETLQRANQVVHSTVRTIWTKPLAGRAGETARL